ncbi:ATP-binding protein [Dyella sp.]|uniref:ATP-binding protein n=1 Tax=Dyella sp. TaxID=1869338 RepID=UPI002ED51C73
MTPNAHRHAPEGELDLDACAREPIQIPGGIQPYGMLFVLDSERLTVLQRAIARPAMLEAFAEPLGQSIDQLLGGALGHLADPLNRLQDQGTSYLGQVHVPGLGDHHAVAHRAEGMIQLELEEAISGEPGSLEDLYPLIRAFMGELERASDTAELCELVALEIRRITGLDRVLVYRFDEAWNGTVIAESRNDVLPSYLDLRFPASDIPAQARELYRLSRLRLIADCNYTPVPFEPVSNPRTGRPADLSFAALRSVSPVHLQYMRNMGTGASMSISILREGRLWGLISCHNQTAKRVPYHVRTACDFLGQIVSLQISAKERASEVEQRVARRAIQSTLLTLMANEDDFLNGLERAPELLLSLTQAGGVAIVHEGRCILLGDTPDLAQVQGLVRWLHESSQTDEFHTECLIDHWPAAADYATRASGLLAVSISQVHASYVLWFRPEVIQTVRWGGDPRKPVDGEKLTPRRSFEAWKETVHMRAIAWGRADVEAALELRTGIVDIVLRRAEELAELNEQLVRSNKELEAFSYSVSHDLRAPFRHIVGYSELLLQSADDKLDDKERRFVATIVESAKSAGSLVDSLLNFSQMGRSTLGKARIDMTRLAREAIQQLELDMQGRDIDWHIGQLPSVYADPVMMRLVLQNLFSNAIKFTRGVEHARIAIECETQMDSYVFRVADNGCGFDMRYVNKLFGVFQRLHHVDEFEGTGIGLANVRRIIERHGGRTWAEGEPGKGATLYFSLPMTQRQHP